MKPVIVECDKKSTKIPSLNKKYRTNKKKIMKLNTANSKLAIREMVIEYI